MATFAGKACFLTCSSSELKACASNFSASTRDFVRGLDAASDFFFAELSSSDADSDSDELFSLYF